MDVVKNVLRVRVIEEDSRDGVRWRQMIWLHASLFLLFINNGYIEAFFNYYFLPILVQYSGETEWEGAHSRGFQVKVEPKLLNLASSKMLTCSTCELKQRSVLILFNTESRSVIGQ